MFVTLAGIPTYVVFQTAATVLYFLLVWHYLSPAEPVSAAVESPGSRRLMHAFSLTLVYLLSNFVAAKLLFDLRNSAAAVDWRNYFWVPHYITGGFWGWPAAFLPAVLAYPWLTRTRPVAIYRAVSLTLPPVLVVQKVACLGIGCCVGRPSDVAWAMTFPAESQCDTPGVPVHPVPLYDIAFALAIYGVMLWLDRSRGDRTTVSGLRAFMFPALLALYGLNRFATEFFRPEYEGRLSTRQMLALGASIAAVAVVFLMPGLWRRVAGEEMSDSLV